MRKIVMVVAVAMLMLTSVAFAEEPVNDTPAIQLDFSVTYLEKMDGDVPFWHVRGDGALLAPLSETGCFGIKGIASAETGYNSRGNTDDTSFFMAGVGYRCLPNQDSIAARWLPGGYLTLGEKYHWGDTAAQYDSSRVLGAGVSFDHFIAARTGFRKLRQVYGASANIVAETGGASDYDVQAYLYLSPFARTSYKVVIFTEGRGSDESFTIGGASCVRGHFQKVEVCVVIRNRNGSNVGAENGWEGGAKASLFLY